VAVEWDDVGRAASGMFNIWTNSMTGDFPEPLRNAIREAGWYRHRPQSGVKVSFVEPVDERESARSGSSHPDCVASSDLRH
jgi:hypothetical protein